ncbi:hypothetical protein glysoja_041430 [Glycine soja]|uniref:Uncharacterized protein n=1 Tax=Glycine soja TaxID=3848 RepID=A0A0B2Q444_GLYSO|nr:hypothetical protein glysoja_041430 [Glycine soja]
MVFHLTGLALLLIGCFSTIHQENELKNDIHTLVGCLLPSVSPGQELETNFLMHMLRITQRVCKDLFHS